MKRMMAPALHTSTTDRLGPAFTLAAPGSPLHSDAFLSPSHSGSPSLLFFQFLPRGPSGLPSLSDEPLSQNWPHITMPAGPQHTPSAISLRSSVHPLFTLIPGKATLPGLGIWLEMGSRKGRVGPEGHGDGGYEDVEGLGNMTQDTQEDVCSPRTWQFWQLKDNCIEGGRGQDCE